MRIHTRHLTIAFIIAVLAATALVVLLAEHWKARIPFLGWLALAVAWVPAAWLGTYQTWHFKPAVLKVALAAIVSLCLPGFMFGLLLFLSGAEECPDTFTHARALERIPLVFDLITVCLVAGLAAFAAGTILSRRAARKPK